MPDRIAHDHPTIETVTGILDRHGGTNRPEVRFEDAIGLNDGDMIRLVLEGVEYRSKVGVSANGTTTIRGAYETPRIARSPGSGTNAMVEWVAGREIERGRSVHLDVVEPGFKYGLRAPGETATYATGRPDRNLADIANRLEDR